MKKILIVVFSTLIFLGCSSDKNISEKDSFDNSNALYVHLDDIEVKKIDGIRKGYYDNKPFTGILVLTRNNTTAKELREIKDGIGTGVVRSHRGDKTIGEVTVENGMKYRLPIMDSETTKDKEIVYFDNSEQAKVERTGYLKLNDKQNGYDFIREGKCTYYSEDGSIKEVVEYQNDIKVE